MLLRLGMWPAGHQAHARLLPVTCLACCHLAARRVQCGRESMLLHAAAVRQGHGLSEPGCQLHCVCVYALHGGACVFAEQATRGLRRAI